jgi:hypothetical protein
LAFILSKPETMQHFFLHFWLQLMINESSLNDGPIQQQKTRCPHIYFALTKTFHRRDLRHESKYWVSQTATAGEFKGHLIERCYCRSGPHAREKTGTFEMRDTAAAASGLERARASRWDVHLGSRWKSVSRAYVDGESHGLQHLAQQTSEKRVKKCHCSRRHLDICTRKGWGFHSLKIDWPLDLHK